MAALERRAAAARSSNCCAICQEPLGSSEDNIALECAHVFHTTCAREWAATSGQELMKSCPHKCLRPQAGVDRSEAVVITE